MPATGETGLPKADLRRLVAYSLTAGLCALIPLPLLDDWARDLLRKRQALELARGYGVALDSADGKVLGCGYRPPATAEGCLRGCVLSSMIATLRFSVRLIFRKTVRKILFFLTIKDCIDSFSRTLHEGYLLRYALELGVVQGLSSPVPAAARKAPNPGVLRLRRIIEATCDEVDTRPIEKLARTTLSGSWRVLRRTARAMTRRLRSLRRSDEQTVYESLERQGEEELGGLIDELAAVVGGQTAYFARLENQFERRLATGPTEAG